MNNRGDVHPFGEIRDGRDHSDLDRASGVYFVTPRRSRLQWGGTPCHSRHDQDQKKRERQSAEPPFLPYAVGRKAADERDRQAGASRGGE